MKEPKVLEDVYDVAGNSPSFWMPNKLELPQMHVANRRSDTKSMIIASKLRTFLLCSLLLMNFIHSALHPTIQETDWSRIVLLEALPSKSSMSSSSVPQISQSCIPVRLSLSLPVSMIWVSTLWFWSWSATQRPLPLDLISSFPRPSAWPLLAQDVLFLIYCQCKGASAHFVIWRIVDREVIPAGDLLDKKFQRFFLWPYKSCFKFDC